LAPCVDSNLHVRPSWEDLKGRLYCKRAQHNAHGVQHGRAWESRHNPANSLRTLRLSADYVEHLRRKPGPKGRRSSRVLGATPDESFIQRGRRPSGLPHQLRSEMNRLFQTECAYIIRFLESSDEYKPQKRVSVNLVMPDLSLATSEMLLAVLTERPSLEQHPAFRRMWLPCVARLLEIRWRFNSSEVGS